MESARDFEILWLFVLVSYRHRGTIFLDTTLQRLFQFSKCEYKHNDLRPLLNFLFMNIVVLFYKMQRILTFLFCGAWDGTQSLVCAKLLLYTVLTMVPLLDQNAWHAHVGGGKVHFDSQFVEVAPREGSMAEGTGREEQSMAGQSGSCGFLFLSIFILAKL